MEALHIWREMRNPSSELYMMRVPFTLTVTRHFWGDEETNVSRQKSLGASMMVSDYVEEVSGFLQDEENMAHVFLET